MPSTYNRVDQIRTTAILDGQPLGEFAVRSGGQVTSEETKFRPAAMSAQVSIGGPQTVDNVTISRHFDPLRDGAILRTARARAGRGRMTISDQPLDTDGNVFGVPVGVWTGTLMRVAGPEPDANSSDPAMLEIEITPDGTVG